MNTNIYNQNGYTIRDTSFTYKGHTVHLSEVVNLNLIENSRSRKAVNGLIGAFISTCLYFFIAPVMGDYAEWNPVLVLYIAPVVMITSVFAVCYLRTKRYSLEIEKSNGHKGVIDSSNDSTQFLELIEAFNNAKEHSEH